MKKTVLIFVSIFLILSSVISVYAVDDPYGTYDDGIKIDAYRFHTIPALDRLTNGSFEEGFRYWTTVLGEPIKDKARIISEGNNKYIELIGKKQFDGIVSPLFLCEKLESGQMPVVIFDWKGSDDFQIYLSQWVNAGEGSREYRIGLIGGEVVSKAQNENGWNTSITSLNQVLEKSVDGNDNIYLSIGVQRYYNTDIVSYVDNLRIGIVDLETGDLSDYDGNKICILQNKKVKKLSLTQQNEGVWFEPKKDIKGAEADESEPMGDKNNSVVNKPSENNTEIFTVIAIVAVASVIVVAIIIGGIIYVIKIGQK